MRIPQAYYESMMKRYKKSKHVDQTDYSWIETTKKPLVERIQDFAQCKQLQDPKYTRIICETIDAIFEAAVALFQEQDQTLCVQLLGESDSIQIWDLCIQCCDYIIKSANPKIIDMFFSYDHILILLFHNPDYEMSNYIQIGVMHAIFD
ncbi:unnamed protein product (macronuclear) [Paramecium tetraurelia]|uniref:Uncharacterized protein n=1 Tax=Paramecium tetraurelia TaxID=5888 RepID=A0DAX3_PARTE|nr:uncharacterized protein GSPATT00015097001 [Paramecium tetraurelia]CAK80190.1 unnamed protein product [Paramecium tetraurelia]|eukprot:XP_001447587.1 hypothetical protein (macronuclear) [Paramecium tetraurelia strain d4-2]